MIYIDVQKQNEKESFAMRAAHIFSKKCRQHFYQSECGEYVAIRDKAGSVIVMNLERGIEPICYDNLITDQIALQKQLNAELAFRREFDV